MREAAARPVIVPEQVVIDDGNVFISDTFTNVAHNKPTCVPMTWEDGGTCPTLRGYKCPGFDAHILATCWEQGRLPHKDSDVSAWC